MTASTTSTRIPEPLTIDVRPPRSDAARSVGAPARNRGPEDHRTTNLLIGIRWVCLIVAAVLTVLAPDLVPKPDFTALGAVTLWTIWRSISPARRGASERSTGFAVILELAIPSVAVAMTGGWSSPLGLMLLPGIVFSSLIERGLLSVGLAAIVSVLVTLGQSLQNETPLDQLSLQGTQGAMQLIILSSISVLGQRLVARSETQRRIAEAERSEALDGVAELNDANTLLIALHRAAQSLPSSLDIDDVAVNTISNARSLVGGDTAVILLRDETLTRWRVLRAEGTRLAEAYGMGDLPVGAVRALERNEAARLCQLGALSSPDPSVFSDRVSDPTISGIRSFLAGAGSGMYVPLRSRDGVIGLLVIEHASPDEDTDSSLRLLVSLSQTAASAIDNARWFARIRTIAADEERVRIARDLHDRIGQSLAYLGFELERIAGQPEMEAAAPELRRLRQDVRSVVTEVRETLYQIRSDVEPGGSLVGTLGQFLERIQERSGIAITFEHHDSTPLPARQEREMWLIAQEAVVNAERHAQCGRLAVTWRSDGRTAVLEVHDDGKGFASGSGRVDSYGLRGLSERAAAIGARLTIDSATHQGTRITCRLDA